MVKVFGVQWVSPLCVNNGRSLDVNDCMIKFASNYAFNKFLLVGFCCCGPVYCWFYAVVVGCGYRQRCSVWDCFVLQIACSPLCILYIVWTWMFSYGRVFSDQVGERSEG